MDFFIGSISFYNESFKLLEKDYQENELLQMIRILDEYEIIES